MVVLPTLARGRGPIDNTTFFVHTYVLNTSSRVIIMVVLPTLARGRGPIDNTNFFCTYLCLGHILQSYHHGSFADTGKRQRTHRQHKLFCTYLCLGHILQSYHHGSFADTGKRQRTHRQHKLSMYIPLSWTHPPELSSW